jgi:hypothetical protein
MIPELYRRTLVGALFLAVVSCSDNTTTAPEEPGIADTIPPSVVSETPSQGAVGVTIHTTVRVGFSEPIIYNSAAQAAFTVWLGEAPVPGNVFRDGPESLIFRPNSILDFATEYTAMVETQVTDTAGNPLPEDVPWTFTTGGSPPPALSETALLDHIAVLADDSMAGRLTGTSDELRAAEYVRGRFEALGLEPGVSGFLQSFVIPPDAYMQGGETSRNVIASLPGEGALADQWVIVGAHYDHLGVREVTPGQFEVYNGADDNASGTALVLEIARALSEYVENGGTAGEDRRSFLFVTFGAEEVGLFGSRHYCDNPTVPMGGVVAMLNFDMVGRLRDNQLLVGGLRTSALWDDVLSNYNDDGLAISEYQTCQSCSDHACFRNQYSKPVLWFFTGFHDEYHTYLDDVDLINGPGLATVGELALATLIHIAVRPTPIPFQPAVVSGAGDRIHVRY